jgi:hypothetical protein
MFTTDLANYQVQSQELIRRADHYRLVKSVAGTNSLSSRITTALGQLMVHLGRQLVASAQPSH